MSFSSNKSETKNEVTDPEAARRMAGVAERSQALGEEQWALAKELYMPYEQALVESNQALIKPNEELMRTRMEEGTRDITEGRALKDEQRAQSLKELQTSEPVMAAFYDEVMKPVDVAARESEAEAGVVSEYANVPESVRRNVSRSGVKLTGAKYQNLLKAIALDRAKAVSGSRATARVGARDETLNKLKTGMAARSGINIATDTTPYAQGEEQLGNYQLKSAADTATGLYGNAIAANEAGMKGLSTGSSSGLALGFS